MSKFCENCGAEMDDNQTVCPNCSTGAETEPTNTVVDEPITESTSTAKPVNTKNIAVIAGIVAAVVIVIAIISSIFGSGWKKPINNYFKGQEKADAKTYLSAFPKFYAEKMEDYIDDEALEEDLEDFEDEYGSKIKMSYKVTEKEKIKKDDLQKVQKYIKSVYEEEVKVSAGYKVRIKATIKGSDDKDTDSTTVYVYKIDGKWSYFDVSPSDAKSYLKND